MPRLIRPYLILPGLSVRHRLAERFLSEVLELPWRKVHHEAETWEHMISADVEEAMWKVLGE